MQLSDRGMKDNSGWNQVVKDSFLRENFTFGNLLLPFLFQGAVTAARNFAVFGFMCSNLEKAIHPNITKAFQTLDNPLNIFDQVINILFNHMNTYNLVDQMTTYMKNSN